MLGLTKKKESETVKDEETIARIKDLEGQIKYRGYTPAARAIVEANDERDRLQEERRQEGIRQAAEEGVRKHKRMIEAGRELMANGNLKIRLDGQIVKDLPESLTLTCPNCGQNLNESGTIIQTLIDKWQSCNGSPDDLCIRDARSPLSLFVGLPFVNHPVSCQICGSSHRLLAQLSVI